VAIAPCPERERWQQAATLAEQRIPTAPGSELWAFALTLYSALDLAALRRATSSLDAAGHTKRVSRGEKFRRRSYRELR
jgi:hypothetical protein